MQFIVISLKAGLFEGSETLVGVMRDQGINSSKALTLDVSLLLSPLFLRTIANWFNSCANINLELYTKKLALEMLFVI